MTDLFTPLDDDELELLDNFLSSRVDDEQYEPGMDEGVYELTGLDGFFTAIVSSPVMIPPSQWLPALWGDFEPEWENLEGFEAIFPLLTRHMNVIAGMLKDMPEEFEPFFQERTVEGRTYTIVDEWCEGYVRGIGLIPELWAEGGEQMDVYLIPIHAFTETGGWHGHEVTEQEAVNLQQAIPQCVREIHAYWLARREEFEPGKTPVRRSETHVGRNDPCPCGSGKKYKQCCLH
jgi:uncharacterized protein